MNNKHIKTLLILFSLIFAIRVITIFTADRLYSMSMAVESGKITPEQAITLLDAATKLDSTNAELYFQKFKTLKLTATPEKYKTQLALLKKVIDLCPSWPAYHLNYALTINKMTTRPNILTRQRIQQELKKAATLKPFSDLYKRIYEKFKAS